MSHLTIVEGNRRRFVATFAVPDANGDPTDPTTVTFYRRKRNSLDEPEAWVFGTDEEVVRDELGVFGIYLDFAVVGSFAVGAKGTGDCASYAELVVVVVDAQASG